MAIETLSISRRLQGAGVSTAQAEAFADIIREARDDDLSRLASKTDLSELNVWLISAMVGIAGLALAITKFT